MITVNVVIITESNFQLPSSYFQPLILVSLNRTQVNFMNFNGEMKLNPLMDLVIYSIGVSKFTWN